MSKTIYTKNFTICQSNSKNQNFLNETCFIQIISFIIIFTIKYLLLELYSNPFITELEKRLFKEQYSSHTVLLGIKANKKERNSLNTYGN